MRKSALYMSSVPDLPGILVQSRSDQELWLKGHVARLCNLDNDRKFPGSQPVSFGSADLDKLTKQDFWVCEKSDGVRVLFLIHYDINLNNQMAYIIDRHYTYRQIDGMYFPHYDDPALPLRNTLIDGELVIDVDPVTKSQTVRLLAFDCLVVDDSNVMSRPLDKRYGRLQEHFYKPYAKMARDMPDVVKDYPFSISVKQISLSYHVEKVFNVDIPALQHGNDGLIYTCVSAPYTAGTDKNILKWKPPSENSIDFRLVLRFPPLPNKITAPDFLAKPIFYLHVWCGGGGDDAVYEPFDEMYVTDEEWEKMKLSGEQFDDRIVEVHWDAEVNHWRMMRFRDDKPNGNHRSVVDNIIQSIADGVQKEALLARSNDIRNAWKARAGQPGSQPPPTNAKAQPHHQHPSQPQHPPAPPPLKPVKAPEVEIRYGPLAPSRWSKVSGPAEIAGIRR